jgi:2,4-dienoyl-CoA reductase-like NADH-dependent reductase (Old Yellow Enzyme family)/thioredoxin reductase
MPPTPMFDLLFTPIFIGTMELKNRIVMPAMHTGFATAAGAVTQRLIDYYVQRADGEVGLIVVELSYVDPLGNNDQHRLAVHEDRLIPGLRRLAAAVQAAGAKVALQIGHVGRRARSAVTGFPPVAPSPIPCLGGEVPRELSVEEIAVLVDAFAQAARRAQESGFDALELHMAHGYLVHQFLSPYSNKRSDKYGGDVTGRARFAVEIVRRVRKNVGPRLPILCKISADEYINGGITLAQSQTVALMLEEAGMDAITVSGGMLESAHMITQPMAVARGCHVHLAEAMKQTVTVPVIAVGRINTPVLAEEIVREGKSDLVAMGRALIADPGLPRKAAEGKLGDICPCVGCNQGCLGRGHRHLDISCLANPRVGREKYLKIERTDSTRKVLVAGGGPAGLEAAWVAAARGHEVILCEQAETLGGRLALAALPPCKEEMGNLITYLLRQVGKQQGVTVRAPETVTLETIQRIRPDVIILATGAKLRRPRFKGIEDNAVATAEEVLRCQVRVGQRVLISGGGMVGCETADFLAQTGKEIVILTRQEGLAPNMEPRSRNLLIERLLGADVQFLTHAHITELADREVIIERGGLEERLIGIDTVVLAAGYVPDNGLSRMLDGIGLKVHCIGDCRKRGTALEAIHDGFVVGCLV